MESLKGDVYGRLVVGCSTTVGKYVLPFLLASFMQQHPKVEASCYVTPRKMAVQMLCDGEVHAALASAQELNPNLQFCKFITDRVSLIVPLSHPWAKREWIDPDELMDVNFIWREEGSGTRYVAEEKLREHGIGINQLKTTLTLGNSEAIALAVQEGIGVRRVKFIPVTPETPASAPKTNVQEPALVSRLIYTFQPLYAANELEWKSQTAGIITPWRAQIARILQELEQLNVNISWITVDTVERYQGGARDIIIISLCANKASQLQALVSLSSDGVDRKLNVALTRARKHLVIIGNPVLLEGNETYKEIDGMGELPFLIHVFICSLFICSISNFEQMSIRANVHENKSAFEQMSIRANEH